MFRRLSAIEIAEGALLADLALIFQLAATYLPIGGGIFRGFTFVIFAMLVLRRGLYVGIMGMFISFFLVSVTIGPTHIPIMSLQAMGGLFLGYTMRLRLHHIPLILLGATCGALALFVLVMISFLLAGLHVNTIMQPFYDLYHTALPIIGKTAARLHFAMFWHNQLYPLVNTLVNFFFTYWLLLVYLSLWVVLVPVVTVIYLATNILVRMLGYQVRPFPDGLLNRVLQQNVRTFLVMSRSREPGWLLRFLIMDLRRTSALVKRSLWPRSKKQGYKA
jgi:hypothetical protein